MGNKIKYLLISLSLIFSGIYLISNTGSSIMELNFFLKNDSLLKFPTIGVVLYLSRTLISILIFVLGIFILKKINAKYITSIKILNVLFYIIFLFSILLLILMFNYYLTNPSYFSEIQTPFPFGRLHFIFMVCFIILTVPLIGMSMSLILLFINYKINKNNKII